MPSTVFTKAQSNDWNRNDKRLGDMDRKLVMSPVLQQIIFSDNDLLQSATRKILMKIPHIQYN